MWFYVILLINSGFVEESPHDIFITKEICEFSAIIEAKALHSIKGGGEYGYICKFDDKAKEYKPFKLEE